MYYNNIDANNTSQLLMIMILLMVMMVLLTTVLYHSNNGFVLDAHNIPYYHVTHSLTSNVSTMVTYNVGGKPSPSSSQLAVLSVWWMASGQKTSISLYDIMLCIIYIHTYTYIYIYIYTHALTHMY